MHCLPRILFAGAAAISLPACVATLVLWSRSYYWNDGVLSLTPSQRKGQPLEHHCRTGWLITSSHGCVQVWHATPVFASLLWSDDEPNGFRFISDPLHSKTLVDPFGGRLPTTLGFWFRGSSDACHWALAFPYWFATLLSAVLPTLWLFLTFRRWRRRRRVQAHLCPACGYDVRASSERCPECGAAIAESQTLV